MAKFQINILGCGSATPTTRHNPSCQVIDFRDRLLMIDCGEGAQVEMRRIKLRYQRLTDIFITHLHGDHCFGLPGLLSTMAMQQKGGKVRVYMPAGGMELMRSFINYFCRESPYDIEFHGIGGTGGIILDEKALTVEAFPLCHRLPCYGFIFREKHKPRHIDGEAVRFFNVPVSKLAAIRDGADFVRDDGTVIANSRLTRDADPAVSYAYATDTDFSPAVADAVRGVDVLYHDSTYADDHTAMARDHRHSTAREAARIAAMAGVKKLIIGHFSKRYEDVSVLLDQAREEFDCVVAADEGLRIDLE